MVKMEQRFPSWKQTACKRKKQKGKCTLINIWEQGLDLQYCAHSPGAKGRKAGKEITDKANPVAFYPWVPDKHTNLGRVCKIIENWIRIFLKITR